jgi:hypothetical protein
LHSGIAYRDLRASRRPDRQLRPDARRIDRAIGGAVVVTNILHAFGRFNFRHFHTHQGIEHELF